ncbi:MAG TPA: hypothetical protein VG847_13010 [Chitinophagaceae bacterium]|nr:hypothetical protein [Chitinophagaceae bacterium]
MIKNIRRISSCIKQLMADQYSFANDATNDNPNRDVVLKSLPGFTGKKLWYASYTKQL